MKKKLEDSQFSLEEHSLVPPLRQGTLQTSLVVAARGTDDEVGDVKKDSILLTPKDDQAGFQETDSIIHPTITTTTTTGPHPRRTIQAELVPDDDEMEARFVEQMEDQITQEVEERLVGNIVVATEVEKMETMANLLLVMD